MMENYAFPGSDNATEEGVASRFSLSEQEGMYCFSVGISLLGLVGNGIVLWYLGFHIRRNPFTVYILNLAVAQVVFLFTFSIAAIVLLLTFHGLIKHRLLYEIAEALYMFGFLASQLLLTAISVEWCVSTWCPDWYLRRRHKDQSTITCAVVWIVSCLTVVTWHLLCGYGYQACLGMYIAQSVLDVLVFIPLMLLFSLTMGVKICRSPQRSQIPKLYLLLLATVLAFLVLTVPIKLVLFLKVTLHNFAAAILCFCLNGTLNPIIYFLVGSLRRWRLKHSIYGALQKAFQDELALPLPNKAPSALRY